MSVEIIDIVFVIFHKKHNEKLAIYFTQLMHIDAKVILCEIYLQYSLNNARFILPFKK